MTVVSFLTKSFSQCWSRSFFLSNHISPLQFYSCKLLRAKFEQRKEENRRGRRDFIHLISNQKGFWKTKATWQLTPKEKTLKVSASCTSSLQQCERESVQLRNGANSVKLSILAYHIVVSQDILVPPPQKKSKTQLALRRQSQPYRPHPRSCKLRAKRAARGHWKSCSAHPSLFPYKEQTLNQ